MSGLDRFRVLVGCIVMAVWVASVFIPTVHDPSAVLQIVMTGFAGWLFAGPVVEKVSQRTRRDDDR